MKDVVLDITTSAGGAATVNANYGICGRWYAIKYMPGSIATGATITVTCQDGASKPLLIKANAGTSNSWYYPRDLVHGVADGAALTGTRGGDRELPVLSGRPRVVVSAGGATKAGSLTLYYS